MLDLFVLTDGNLFIFYYYYYYFIFIFFYFFYYYFFDIYFSRRSYFSDFDYERDVVSRLRIKFSDVGAGQKTMQPVQTEPAVGYSPQMVFY